MSNYLSAPLEVSPVKSSLNLPLIDKVLSMKQGAYDTNKAKIDQTLALYGEKLQGLRPEDNEYIASRVNDISTFINSNNELDLSLSSNASALTQQVNSIIKDPVIMDAILNKNKKMAYDQQYAERVKKGDGKANQTNYNYGLSRGGYDSYMKGTSKSINDLNYIDYYDESKEFKDLQENLNKYAEDVEKTLDPTGRTQGYIYTKKGKVLSEQEVSRQVNALLSNNARQQMQINGWATYDKGSTEEEKMTNVLSSFNSFSEGEIAKTDKAIKDGQLGVVNGTITASSLAELVTFRDKQKEQYDSWMKGGNKEQMYTHMYTQDKINNFASSIAFDHTNEVITSDATFLTTQKLKYDREDEMWNREIETQKLNLERQKAGLASDGSDLEGNIQTKADPNFQPSSETGNFVTKQRELITGLDNVLNAGANMAYQELDASTQKLIDEKVKNSNGSLTRADVLINLGSTSNKIVSAQVYKNLSQIRLEKALNQQTINKYSEKARQELEGSLDTESTIKELVDNNAKILWKGMDGRETLLSAKNILSRNGVVDNNGNIIGNLSSKPSIVEAIKKTIILDKLSQTSTLTPNEANSLREQLNTLTGGTSMSTSNKVGFRGESPIATITTYSPNSEVSRLENMYKNSQGSNINRIESIKNYNRSLDTNQINKRVNEFLSKDATLSIGKEIVVDPKSSAFSRLASLMGNINTDSKYSISMKVDPTQPNMVKVKQYVPASGSNPATTTPEVSLRIEDLPTQVTSQINLLNSQQKVTVKDIPEIKQTVKYGDMSSKSSLKDISETFFGGVKGKPLAKQTTKDGALGALFTINQKLTGTRAEPTEIGNILNKIVQDDSLAVSLVKGSSNDAYPTIIRREKGEDRVLWQSDDWVDDRNVKEAYERIQYTPQIVVNGWIAELLRTNNITQLKSIYGE